VEISGFSQDFSGSRLHHGPREARAVASFEENRGDDRSEKGPALPYVKAFVVQFTADTDARLEHVRGRVEHLQTGRRAEFRSTDELLARIAGLLRSESAR